MRSPSFRSIYSNKSSKARRSQVSDMNIISIFSLSDTNLMTIDCSFLFYLTKVKT